MRILLCNDDGIDSLGLMVLAKRLSKQHEVMIVAPDGNRSAFAHSLSIRKPISLTKREDVTFCNAFVTNGTPCDCVKLAFLLFPDFKPDVVMAGINKGHNIGDDILYSATLSIGIEASFFGVPAFCFSAYSLGDSDFDLYTDYAVKIFNKMIKGCCKNDVYNINFPDEKFSEISGVKITKLGRHVYSDRYEVLGDNNYKLVGEPLELEVTDYDTDVEWLKRGYITVTPIIYDKTDYEKLEKVKNLCEEL